MSTIPDAQFDKLFPDQLAAPCSREQAAQLVTWDYHSVTVNGRRCVMLAYAWMSQPLEEQQEPFVLAAVPRYAGRHPPAPPEIQAIADQLDWH